MSRIKQQVYYSILKTIVYCCITYAVVKGVLAGVFFGTMMSDLFYLFLIMFLRSTMISPVWRIGFKWTVIVSIPIEAILYGGGALSHMIAAVSFMKYLFNYGFVLYWNPVLKKKDTLANRMIEITLSSIVLAVFAPLRFQTLLVQIVLSIHSFWAQTKIVDDVCNSEVMKDTRGVLADVASECTPGRHPIELWRAAYYAAVNKTNILPQDIVDMYLVPSTPWQLRRLIVKSISVDPTRSHMKSLMTVASGQPVGGRVGTAAPTLWTRGPLALINEEPNEKVVVNEAIAGLTRLFNSLGEKKFVAAFDRSTDGKAAVDLVHAGFK